MILIMIYGFDGKITFFIKSAIFIENYFIFQEFCLDLYQPSGMGKRRKRNDRSIKQGEVEYFYPVTKSRENSRILKAIEQNRTEILPTSTDIDDNVGVTVLLPEGKLNTLK